MDLCVLHQTEEKEIRTSSRGKIRAVQQQNLPSLPAEMGGEKDRIFITETPLTR